MSLTSAAFVTTFAPQTRHGHLLSQSCPRPPVQIARRRILPTMMQAPLSSQSQQSSQPSAAPPFRLGVCLSGAASGGAYAAGVLDFLFEALSAWAQHRASVNGWRVVLSDLAGTSAGGVTAALAATSFNARVTPNASAELLENARENPMFSTWVSLFTAETLLSSSDLDSDPAKPLQSLLNADFMPSIVDAVLPEPEASLTFPDWVEPNISLLLTTVNLRGVRYAIDFANKDPGVTYPMTRHEDFKRFHFTHPSSSSASDHVSEPMADSYSVSLANSRSEADWFSVIESSRATAALPAIFPTVRVDMKPSDYKNRQASSPVAPEDDYSYAAVDGGLLNNSPFALLHSQMETRHNRRFASDASSAWGTVLLVDPFPDAKPLDDSLVSNSLPVLTALLATNRAVMADAKFKEEDILGMMAPDDLSRYMIAPIRPSQQPEQTILATAGLSSFAGMIDEKIRRHDFLLGRQNCQAFLRDTLRIPAEDARANAIFADAELSAWTDEKDGMISIVPLVGSAATPINLPAWPEYSEEEARKIVESLSDLVDARARVVLDRLWDSVDAGGAFTELLWNLVGLVGKGSIRRTVTKTAEKAFDEAMTMFQV